MLDQRQQLSAISAPRLTATSPCISLWSLISAPVSTSPSSSSASSLDAYLCWGGLTCHGRPLRAVPPMPTHHQPLHRPMSDATTDQRPVTTNGSAKKANKNSKEGRGNGGRGGRGHASVRRGLLAVWMGIISGKQLCGCCWCLHPPEDVIPFWWVPSAPHLRQVWGAGVTWGYQDTCAGI